MTPITSATPAIPVAQTEADGFRNQRLHKAAHQFEAMMLGEMLKPLTQTSEDALNGEDSTTTGPLQSFGMEAVAGALSNSNALGFARQIERALVGHSASTKAAALALSGSEK